MTKPARKDEDIDRITLIVKDTIRRDFGTSKIIDVFVIRDIDEDEDEVLRIFVVFEGTSKNLDAKKLSGATRRVKSKLWDIGERAFPLLSFISKGDLGKTKLASA